MSMEAEAKVRKAMTDEYSKSDERQEERKALRKAQMDRTLQATKEAAERKPDVDKASPTRLLSDGFRRLLEAEQKANLDD